MPDPALPAFDGWDTPHYTPIPDQLFDEWLPHLSEAELKVLLYIMRHTFGWKKDSDAISLRQMAEGILRRDGTPLDHGAGIALRSIQRALPLLEAKGLILAERQVAPDGGAATTVYRPRMGCSQNDYTGCQKIQGGVAKMTTGGVAKMTTTRNTVQETDSQETDSNHAPAPKTQRPRQDATATPASAAAAPTSPTPYSGPHSPYIAGVLFDHSSDLGDRAHKAANSTQAHRLWQVSGLGEAAFVTHLHEARRLVRTYQGKQGTGTIAHKMAYYFAVLADLSRPPQGATG